MSKALYSLFNWIMRWVAFDPKEHATANEVALMAYYAVKAWGTRTEDINSKVRAYYQVDRGLTIHQMRDWTGVSGIKEFEKVQIWLQLHIDDEQILVFDGDTALTPKTFLRGNWIADVWRIGKEAQYELYLQGIAEARKHFSQIDDEGRLR